LKQDFDYIPGKNNCSGDFYFEHTDTPISGEFEVLIFADSRGYFLEDESASWAIKLFQFFKNKKISSIVIIRPKDQTGIFTFCNFLEFSELKFRYAICQIGLVEFLPKSNDFIQDLFVQKNLLFTDQDFALKSLGKSLVLKKISGKGGTIAEYEELSSMDINTPEMKSALVSYLGKHLRYALFLGALELDPKSKLSRLRPKSFFDQIRLSNMFLNELSDMSKIMHFIKPYKAWMQDSCDFVHDGAHYSANSHYYLSEIAKIFFQANVSSR
jgi:hypothetical protein